MWKCYFAAARVDPYRGMDLCVGVVSNSITKESTKAKEPIPNNRLQKVTIELQPM